MNYEGGSMKWKITGWNGGGGNKKSDTEFRIAFCNCGFESVFGEDDDEIIFAESNFLGFIGIDVDSEMFV